MSSPRRTLACSGSHVALLLSLLYAVALSRFRRTSSFSEPASALVVAGGGFAVFALAPGLKYPANPPAVGDPDTVTERTLLYACAIAIAALTLIALLTVVRTARRRGWSSTRTSSPVCRRAPMRFPPTSPRASSGGSGSSRSACSRCSGPRWVW